MNPATPSHKARGGTPRCGFEKGAHRRRPPGGAPLVGGASDCVCPVVVIVSVDWTGDPDEGVTVPGSKEQIAPGGTLELEQASVIMLLHGFACGVGVTVIV